MGMKNEPITSYILNVRALSIAVQVTNLYHPRHVLAIYFGPASVLYLEIQYLHSLSTLRLAPWCWVLRSSVLNSLSIQFASFETCRGISVVPQLVFLAPIQITMRRSWHTLHLIKLRSRQGIPLIGCCVVEISSCNMAVFACIGGSFYICDRDDSAGYVCPRADKDSWYGLGRRNR